MFLKYGRRFSRRSEAVSQYAVVVGSLILAVISLHASHAALADDLIPPEIAGVWTSEGAVIRNQGALFEGQALYLQRDGGGAMIGGPPPIGFSIVSTFNSTTNKLTIRFSPEKDQPCQEIPIVYDPQAKTLSAGSSLLLRRHLDNVPEWLSKEFARNPTHCTQ